MSWVLDCSIAMAWCFEDESTPRTEQLLDRLNSDPAVVPLHWPSEVANVLRSAVRKGRLTKASATERLAVLTSLPIRYDALTHQLASSATWQLVKKYDLTSYDAAYLELAIRLGAPLATNDGDLRAAAERAGVETLWCGEYPTDLVALQTDQVYAHLIAYNIIAMPRWMIELEPLGR